jgi:hypothetical protein
MKGEISNVKISKPDKWEIEGWCRTLREAEAIKNDPKKMKLLTPFLKKEIKSIEDLKDLLSEKMEDSDESSMED